MRTTLLSVRRAIGRDATLARMGICASITRCCAATSRSASCFAALDISMHINCIFMMLSILRLGRVCAVDTLLLYHKYDLCAFQCIKDMGFWVNILKQKTSRSLLAKNTTTKSNDAARNIKRVCVRQFHFWATKSDKAIITHQVRRASSISISVCSHFLRRRAGFHQQLYILCTAFIIIVCCGGVP